MNKKPLISILMGIYNCSNTLEEAVQSILAQTYDNWELIMCDDASSDDTYDVAKKLSEKDSRIILVRNEKNITLAPTLNKCLEIARGEYVARMDGDDVCSSDRLEKELVFLEEHPEYALVSCNMDLFDQDGVYRTVVYSPSPTKEEFVKNSPFCHAGCMMRASVLHKLNGYSELKERQRVEDYDLWVRMYSCGFVGFNLPESLYAMRDDRNAFHRRTFNNRLNEIRVKIDVCRNFRLSVKYYCWTIVPILKWMVPSFIYEILHKN